MKLDELIRSVSGARNRLMDLETLSDEELQKFQNEFERLRKRSEATAATVSRVARKSEFRLSPRFACADEFPARRTKAKQFAIATIGLAREAAATPVPDEPVAPLGPLSSRN